MLLREVEKRTHGLDRTSECFEDRRDPERIEHSVESSARQRVMGPCPRATRVSTIMTSRAETG